MRILLALALLAFTACAAPPPPQAAVDAADYGEAPLTHRSDVRAALAAKLIDPPSALLDFGEPFRAAVQSGKFEGEPGPAGYAAGWVVPVTVKARRADGTYTGRVPRRFFFPAAGGVFELHAGQRLARPSAQPQAAVTRSP